MSENQEENECYIGKSVDKGILNDIRKYLDQDETVIGIFNRKSDTKQEKGIFAPKGIQKYYLILTNKRIILYPYFDS